MRKLMTITAFTVGIVTAAFAQQAPSPATHAQPQVSQASASGVTATVRQDG